MKIRSAMKRLNRSGDKGSPWWRPTLDVKAGPSRVPSLMCAGVLQYVLSIRPQNFGPSPLMTILQKRRGRHTLLYAFWRVMKACIVDVPSVWLGQIRYWPQIYGLYHSFLG